MSTPAAVRTWHEVVRTGDKELLQSLLTDGVVFRSPAVHTPQAGRALTTQYLEAAMAILGPNLQYHRQWFGPDSAVLEFTTVVDDIEIHGVDIMTWNDDDRLVDFTVMVRPQKGLATVIERVGAELMRQSSA
jgi:hypothetical protein